MQKFSRILTGLGIVIGVVALGVFIGWLGSRGSMPKPQSPGPGPGAAESTSPNNAAPARVNPPLAASARGPGGNPSDAAVPMPVAPAAATTLVTNWEDHVDEILGSETEETNKVKQLFALFPRLTEEGQTEVAQHLSNLVDDPDYAPLGKLLANAKLGEPVLDVLMADILNRPNSVKLPVLLEVAQNPDHVKAGEAKDILELYLDEDYGANWIEWDRHMRQWLKENPD
jgi:hypothetical protein